MRLSRCASRAWSSSGGRSRLPTWSARYGGAITFGSYHRPRHPESKLTLNRRQFIERTGLAVGALGLPLLLEACTPAAPSTSPAAPSSAGGAAKPANLFPTYVAFPNK